MNLLTNLFGKKLSPLEEITLSKDQKNAKGIIKHLRNSQSEIGYAAIDALKQIKDSLTPNDLNTLVAIRRETPKLIASRVDILLHSIQSEAFDKVKEGMSTQDVLKIMRQPNQQMSGRDFVSTYHLGVIMSRGDTAWLDSPHWIYKWIDDQRSYYVIEFKNGLVKDKRSVDNSGDGWR